MALMFKLRSGASANERGAEKLKKCRLSSHPPSHDRKSVGYGQHKGLRADNFCGTSREAEKDGCVQTHMHCNQSSGATYSQWPLVQATTVAEVDEATQSNAMPLITTDKQLFHHLFQSSIHAVPRENAPEIKVSSSIVSKAAQFCVYAAGYTSRKTSLRT